MLVVRPVPPISSRMSAWSASCARIRSATASAPSSSVPGSSTANSSPPMRAGRVDRRAAVPRSRSANVRSDVVAGGMPEAVVDALEVVEVGEEERQRRAEPLRAGDLGLERLDEAAAVDEPGELVGDRLLAHDLVEARVLERDRGLRGEPLGELRSTRARSPLRAGRRRAGSRRRSADSPRSSSIGSSPAASPTRASSRSSSSTRPPARRSPRRSRRGSRGSSPLVSCVEASALPTSEIASRGPRGGCAPPPSGLCDACGSAAPRRTRRAGRA